MANYRASGNSRVVYYNGKGRIHYVDYVHKEKEYHIKRIDQGNGFGVGDVVRS